MFTGIIEQTGTIIGLTEVASGGVKRLTVAAAGVAGRLREGDSLAVSGVCLTALDVNPEFFHADLALETLERTSLGELAAGSLVNLELPTAAGAPLGGHIVQGHVDGTGVLAALEPVVPGAAPEDTDWWLTIQVPDNVLPYMVEKGSIAIEGISLTIAHSTIPSGGDTIRIAVLPLTYSRTNLHALKPGAPVNVEADVMVKFAALQARSKSAASELTETWLVANGY